jgi:5-formaminoimidazole-4-carboxamide-1-(beta)-D-ribofuranosyl 5'-monophosphate synthetase
LPATFKTPEDIDRLIIANYQGAKGGRGYFLANSPKNFYKQFNDMVKRGMLTQDDLASIHLQEYALGVNVYPSYFSSIINDDVELLCDGQTLRISCGFHRQNPCSQQLEIDINPTYTVVGNFPIVLRESLLPEIMRMGENVHKKARELSPPGIIGPSASKPS